MLLPGRDAINNGEADDVMTPQADLGSLPLHKAILAGASEGAVMEELAAYPDATNKKDKDGRLPLHWSIIKGASEGLVKALLEVNPDAAMQKDKFGRLPLHWAIEKGASEGIVTALLAAYPDAAKYKDEDGRLPLHCMGNGMSEGVVRALLAAYPSAAEDKDKFGRLPLHCMGSWASEGVAMALLAAYPDATKQIDEDGRLPLHDSIEKNAWEDAVRAVLEAYPAAAMQKDKDGRLPLHWAIEKGASDGIVTALLASYPDAAQFKDKDGRLPLHCMGNGTSEGVVRTLLAACPDAAEDKDKFGRLPLHCMGSWASEGVAMALLAAYPDATKQIDEFGRLPLHYMCSWASEGMVKAVLAAHPDATSYKDEDGRLPLHCMGNGTSEGVVRALLAACPDAAKEKDKDARLPLHWSIEMGASEDAVRAVLEAYPGAAKERDKFGRLPLHWSIEEGNSEGIVTALLAAYPDAAKYKDNDGRLPLHCMGNGTSEGAVRALLAACPDAANEKDKFGRLPLHCMGSWASEGVVRAVLAAHPDATKQIDEDGRLPLHDSIVAGASEDVVTAQLLATYPDATNKKDKDGRLPLHWSIVKGSSEGLVKALLAVNPDATKQEDKFGGLPLHLAIAKGASEGIVTALLTAYPDTAKYKDKEHGKLPLHYINSNTSEGVVRTLLAAYPDAAKEKDKDGNLPLHCAIRHKASEGMVTAVLAAYPDAAKERDEDGRLPLNKALVMGVSEGVVTALLAADMPVALVSGHPLRLHSFSWNYCVSKEINVCVRSVERMLSDPPSGYGYGRHVMALAETLDKQGRPALDAASREARRIIYQHLLFCGRYQLHFGPPEHRSTTSVVLRAQDKGSGFPDYGAVFDKHDTNPKDGFLNMTELNAAAGELGLDVHLLLAKGADEKTCRIPRDEFIATCIRLLGNGLREVAIKLMQDEKQWVLEKRARSEQRLAARFVVHTLEAPDDEEVRLAVESLQGGLKRIKEAYLPDFPIGTRMLVMDAADRNLHQIYLQERPDVNALRVLLQQVFSAVEHLHEQNLMHGDVKMLNLVRFHVVEHGQLRLIDLDASAPISEETPSYAGAKFSSAILPPELIHQLKRDAERDELSHYWESSDAELKAKVAPLKARDGRFFVVKSFRTDAHDEPIRVGLPYKLVEASPMIDCWALGALAYTLSTGEPLVSSTRDDDCASGDAMALLHNWGNEPVKVHRRLQKVLSPTLRDLISRLLQRNPMERHSVKAALAHVFFRSGEPQRGVLEALDRIEVHQMEQAALLDKLEQSNTLILNELKRMHDVLLKAIFEATEVNAPTTFVVLREKLPSPPLKEEIEKLVNEYKARFDEGMQWVKRTWDVGMSLMRGDVSSMFAQIKEGLGDLVIAERMYFYLIDELTGEPVIGEGYPIEITTPAEVVPKLLPVMQVGMRAISICNGAAGIARAFGFPVPTVPREWSDGARESIELLKQKSSVAKFGVVHREVNRASEDTQAVRGASLRELQGFLMANDPGLRSGGQGLFAGLRRIGDPEDGTAIWTALSDPVEVRAAIEARARERLKEEQAHEEHYIAMMLTQKKAADDVSGGSPHTVATSEVEASPPADDVKPAGAGPPYTVAKSVVEASPPAEDGKPAGPGPPHTVATSVVEASPNCSAMVCAYESRLLQTLQQQIEKIKHQLSEQFAAWMNELKNKGAAICRAIGSCCAIT